MFEREAAMSREISAGTALGELATRHPVCVPRDTTILAACRVMRACQVGELVVTEEPQGLLVAVGIVSARDIVTWIIAPGLDPAVFTVGDIAWAGTARAKVSDSLSDTLRLLKATRTNVLPVIDDDGSLAGIISLNDVLLALGKV
jgi:CBS domain-containing protein